MSSAPWNRRSHLQLTKIHCQCLRVTSLRHSRLYLRKMRRRVDKETTTTPRCSGPGKGKPSPIILTSEASLISLQTELKRVLSWEFFRSTATGTRITTKNCRHCESRETEFRVCRNLLQLRPVRRRIAATSKLQRLQSCKTGITTKKEPTGDNTGVRTEDVLLEIRSTWSIICCCSSQLRSATSAATITTKIATVFRN
jgi:hypothetical protein